MNAAQAAVALVTALRGPDDGTAVRVIADYLDRPDLEQVISAAALVLDTLAAHLADILDQVPAAAADYDRMAVRIARDAAHAHEEHPR